MLLRSQMAPATTMITTKPNTMRTLAPEGWANIVFVAPGFLVGRSDEEVLTAAAGSVAYACRNVDKVLQARQRERVELALLHHEYPQFSQVSCPDMVGRWSSAGLPQPRRQGQGQTRLVARCEPERILSWRLAGLNDEDLLGRLPPEERARVMIDRLLAASEWAVQDAARANLSASRGVAIREFILEPPHIFAGDHGALHASHQG